MNKFTLRHLIGLFLMLITCVGNMFSQSIVNFGSDLYSTKYYESMNASNPPSGAWYAVDYDDSNWKSYTNPINFPEYDAFWVRRTFFIIDDPANHSFQLQFAHDNDAVIYINGHILHDCQGGNVCGRYNYVDIPNIYLAEGINVLAAYVLDGGGEQYLECFINTTDGSDIIADLPKNPMLLISESSLYLYTVEGHTDYTLNAQMITPTGKVDTEISWTSSNPEVVSVDNGQLVALSAGNSVVTATTTYNGSLFSKECEVEVREINPMSKIVTVEEPGTLGSLLTDEEKDNIDNLTIFGKLDGSDIQVLRYMAGRNERGNRTPGTLAELNIYNVEFVNGNNGSFKVSNDYTGYIEAGKLPNALFRNCVALNSIILPKNISRIGSEAFRECTNLETIVIPDEVSVIEGSVFSGCTNLKSIEIPASVISMGGSIFENCKRLENIVFAEGINLTSIPDWTFGYGNKIKAITIPASVTSIGYYAFYDNNNLENVIFEDGSQLVEIKGQSFYSCDNLQSINIPEGCLEIGNESFAGCYNLSRVTLPVSVASIGDGAFRYCNLLTDFEIPENSKLSSIGAYAFEGTNLSSFYIPKGLISIDDVFSNTTNLQTLTVHPDNKYYESVGGIVYSKRDKSALLVPKSIDGFLSFPDYVTSIPENLLQGCSRLKGIILHSGITSIGNNAFSGCAGLQTLMLLSSTPTTVSDLSLSGINKSVVTLVAPQGSSDAYITADGWNTFENIVEASEQPTILLSANNVIVYDVNYESARKAAVSATVITKDGISSIPVSWSTSNANIATVNDGIVEYAGEGTATITASVTVGEYTSTSTCIVTSVGMSSGKMVYVDKAGNLSSLLTDEEKDDLTHLIVMGELNNDDIRVLRYMAGVDEYGGLTVGSLEVLDMGKARIVSGGENGYYYRDNYWRVVGDNYFGELIFSSCNSLKKVVLPSSLTGLGYYAFYGCTNLEEVVLPDGLNSIDHQAFAYCRKLSKVNIPSSVTNMSSWIFYGCTSLKTIDLSSMTGMNIIPDNMFRESGLTSVRIPANITNIQNEAFGGTPLKSLEFEDGSKLTSISDGAFQSTKLQSITIPASTTRLGNNAFNDCRHLSEVLYEENSKLSSIGENVFNGCPLQTFIIPKKLISMGTQDFSDSLKQIVVEEGNKFFEIVDGVLYSTSDNSLVYVPKNKTSVYLPNYVTSIKNGALRYHHNLKTLVLTATIADLGESPFCDSYNLTEIYCMNPTPPAVNNLTNGWGGKIYIPSGCKKAYEDANWESWLLEERSYSNSVVISASSLTLYDAHGGNSADLSSEVFSNNGPVQYSSVIWTSSDYNVVTVDSTGHIRYAGPGTAKITASTTLDETVYTAECNVTSIAVNDPDNAYYLTGNGNLRSLIGEDNKYNIEKLVLVGKLSDDDRNFIREMSCNRWEGGQEVMGSLKYVDLSELGDTVIGTFTFGNCHSLETVILPNNLKRIENEAFAYCSNITSLIIPEGVTELGWGALHSCKGLKSIKFLGMNAPQLSDNVFGGIYSNCCIIVPSASYGYKTQDYWKDMTNVYESDMLPILVMKNSSVELYNMDETIANSEQLEAYIITWDGIKTSGINWLSSESSIATVTGEGVVQAGTAEGEALITASYTENNKTVSSVCKVSVVDVTEYKYVYVANAGTLSDLLSEEELVDTKKLAIAGNLNSNDIRVLRYMAGRDERGNLTVGSLEYLNMSKTRIVSGGEGYYYRDGWWRNVSDNHFGDDIFNSCNSLKKVVLPSTLKSMDSYTFYQCANLEEVVIPEGLTNIGHQAFYECRKLSKVNVPSSITNLSSWAFYGCTSLKSIDLSAMTSVSTIADNTFYESGLTRIQIPANITNIEYDAFRNTPLKRLEFENGSRLATIGDNAFYSTKLDSVIVPSSVTYIGNYAFNNCRQLSYVVYEENSKLNSLGRNVFDGCPIETIFIPRRLISMERQEFSESLKQIVVDEGNQFFEVYDDALCSKAEGSLIYVPKRKKSLYLPEYVTSLKDGVLQYHYDLQTVILSSQIRDLGDSPFYQCTNLKEIYCLNPVSPTARNLTNDFPYTTVYIAKGSFDSYKDAGWDDYRITLVEQSFSNSINLATSEQILYNVEGGNKIKLEAKVFSVNGPVPNAPIDWITSDASVVTVDGRGIITYAGQGNAIITASVTIDGNIYSDSCVVNTKKFDDVDNVTIVIVETPGNLQNQISATDKKAITNLVVLGSINGTDIRFIREMARIPYASWEETPDGSLEYLDLSGATIVEGGGEYGYAEWQDELGRGYGDWASAKANVIGKSMFRNSPTLKTIILPNNVTRIELYAFRDCNKLENVVLPKNLSFIDNDAFNNCPLLSSFVIPESIDSLGANALRGFDAIYANSSTPVKILSYYLISEDAIVIVPADALQSYRAADNWKQFAGQIMPDNLNIQTVAVLDVTAEDEGSGLLTAAGGDDALAFIQDLTLRGTINSYDIMIIRNRMPRLHYLDLSDVRIVANPYEYYTDSHTENNRLGRNAFRELNKLREVILPRTIDYVGDGAFYHCENLTSVKIYNGVNTIDNYAFAECYNLVNVELPEGLLSIGYEVFRSCNRLENISIPSTVLSLGGNAFADCYNLKSVVLPKNLSVIEGSTFWYCENLESVVLPSKVYRIESHAFYHCPKLKELRLPPMIESIGDMAFYDCNNIKDVYVYIANSKDIRIDMKTFSCWTSAILHIPAFSYRSYFYDTQWGQFYSKVEFSETYDEFYTKNTLELNQESGVIQGDPDATLYEQGGLVVSDVEQVLDEVELKSDGTDGASLIATGSGNIKASKLTININVREYQWHFFCFPFDIPLDSIHYDGEYVWRQYDGLARSRREGGWQNLAEGTTKLSKGRGYIFQGTTTGSLSFTIDNPDLSAKDENTNLFTHESQDAQDANWNFIGNPYTSYYNIDETTYSAPITVWTGNGYEAYRPGDDEYRLAPYQAFFVQTPDDANEISFNADSRESYDRVQSTNRRTSSKRGVNQNRLFVELTVTADGESTYTDKTRIVFNNNKSLDYELNCDAAKFFSESRAIELYSIDSNGAIYSINERPTADSVVYLGIKVNVPGTYTIEAIRKDVPVILVDKDLNMVQDIMDGGYSFEAEAGESNRFILRICGDTPTNIINLLNDTERNDKLFDLQGREINDLNVKDIIILNGKKILNNY